MIFGKTIKSGLESLNMLRNQNIVTSSLFHKKCKHISNMEIYSDGNYGPERLKKTFKKSKNHKRLLLM